MKSRQGFVSNSSSTSFVVACNEELSLELLLKHFESDGHPMAWLIDGLAKYIVENAEKATVPPKEKENYNNHVSEKLRALSEKYPFVYRFHAANDDGDSLSCILYDKASRFKIEHLGLVIVGEYE